MIDPFDFSFAPMLLPGSEHPRRGPQGEKEGFHSSHGNLSHASAQEPGNLVPVPLKNVSPSS